VGSRNFAFPRAGAPCPCVHGRVRQKPRQQRILRPCARFLWLFDTLISIYIWLVIGQIVMSWLIQFGIVNARQPFVMQVGEFLYG
jgi:hypothetical protein